MAQLIKLSDYVTRYESALSRYTSLFVRLKKRRWNSTIEAWKKIRLHGLPKQPLLHTEADDIDGLHGHSETPGSLDYRLSFIKTEDELKQFFLDQLVHFQIKWASSTIERRSFVSSEFSKDWQLNTFLQRFPDSYLIMYKPVLKLGKAVLEMDVLILTPGKILCIALLDGEAHTIYSGNESRFWLKSTGQKKEKVLNPLISINRMEKIIQQIFSKKGINLPIQKVILAEKSKVHYAHPPLDVLLVDKDMFGDWLKRLRAASSPPKMMQFRAANALLELTVTTAVRRAGTVDGQG